jgi:hypothetical protein
MTAESQMPMDQRTLRRLDTRRLGAASRVSANQREADDLGGWEGTLAGGGSGSGLAARGELGVQ